MTAAFVVVVPIASSLWRVYGAVVPRGCIKAVHVVFMTTALALAWAGVAAMHMYKQARGGAHWTSLHARIGLGTLSLFTLTWLGIACHNPLGLLACAAL